MTEVKCFVVRCVKRQEVIYYLHADGTAKLLPYDFSTASGALEAITLRDNAADWALLPATLQIAEPPPKKEWRRVSSHSLTTQINKLMCVPTLAFILWAAC